VSAQATLLTIQLIRNVWLVTHQLPGTILQEFALHVVKDLFWILKLENVLVPKNYLSMLEINAQFALKINQYGMERLVWPVQQLPITI
jgi:hypothetical protein